MKAFMDDNFLLQNETAQKLYHEHAAKMPIIDYHCHLVPQMVAENKRFDSITQIWLGGDHYKWRAMRSNGVAERFCTGKETSDWEKFEKWAETVPYTFRNPLYHWTHLELKTAFGINKTLNPENAREIFEECNEQIKNDPKFTPRGLMKHYNVQVVCTTDDPIDSLEYHKQVADDPTMETRMLPTWRPDKAMAVEVSANFKAYVDALSQASGKNISNFNDYIDAIQSRFLCVNGMQTVRPRHRGILCRRLHRSRNQSYFRQGLRRKRTQSRRDSEVQICHDVHICRSRCRSRMGTAIPLWSHTRQQLKDVQTDRPRHRL